MAGKLTKREKTLLYILLCLVIAAGSVCLLLLPAISRNETLQTELDEIAMQKQQMEIKRASLAKNLERIDALNTEYNELYEDMFLSGTATSEKLDLFVTLTALQAGIAPNTLSIASMDYKPITLYAGDASDGDSSAAANTDDAPSIMVANLQISGSCSAVDFQRLTDAFAALPQLVISSASFTEGASQPDEFHLSLEIYLLPAV